MTSERQKKSGYTNPTIQPTETRCFKITVPDDEAFRQAVYAQLTELGKWWNWKRDSERAATESATTWRQLFSLEDEDCMLNCEEVIACLEASPQWTGLLNLTADHTAAIENLQDENETQQDEIDEIQEQPSDGNIYPTAPNLGTTDACGAAWFIVTQFRAWINQVETAADTEPTIFDAINAVFSFDANKLGNVVGDLLRDIFGNVTSVLTVFDAKAEDMRDYLYCVSNAREDFRSYLVSEGLTDIVTFLDCLAQSAWDKWVYLGSFDDSNTCNCPSDPCALPITVDFADFAYPDCVTPFGSAGYAIGNIFGNPVPAIYFSNGGQVGNRNVGVTITLPANTYSAAISASHRAYISSSSIGGYYGHQYFDASNNLLFQVVAALNVNDAWTTRTSSHAAGVPIAYVKVYTDNTTGGTPRDITVALDNVVVS